MLIAVTASLMSARRMIARTEPACASMRQCRELPAGCAGSEFGERAVEGDDRRLAPTPRRREWRGWRCGASRPASFHHCGARPTQQDVGRQGAGPRHGDRQRRSGGVDGGTTTRALLPWATARPACRATDLGPTTRRRGHRRASTTPAACGAGRSGDRRAERVGDLLHLPRRRVIASSESSGGPIVSTSLAASSTRTRWMSMRFTRGPLRVVMWSRERWTLGITAVSERAGLDGRRPRPRHARTAKDRAVEPVWPRPLSTCPELTPRTT